MRRLPLSIVVLVVFLAVFFNLERLDVSQQNLINIQTFVYILITVAIISIIWFQFLRRLSTTRLVILWLVIYLALKILIFNDRGVWGGLNTYLTIVEAAFLVIFVLLAHYIAKYLEEFIAVINDITFDEYDKVLPLDKSKEDIKTELYRSRRFQHPLTLLVVRPEAEAVQAILNQTLQEIQHSLMERYVSVAISKALRTQLRRTDHVYEMCSDGCFVIVTPETGKEHIPDIVRRINEAARQLNARLYYGAASFPDDSLAYEELLQQAKDLIASPEFHEHAGTFNTDKSTDHKDGSHNNT